MRCPNCGRYHTQRRLIFGGGFGGWHHGLGGFGFFPFFGGGWGYPWGWHHHWGDWDDWD